MHGNFTRENREVPSTPDTQSCAGRLEKDVIQKSNMHVDGKSDGRAVPTKCPDKSGNPLAEGMEGRRPAKENTEQTTASQTQSWGNALSGLRGVREAAKKDKRLQFTALLHHVSVLLLESSFYALKRDAAPGVDGVTWTEYETGLGERLKDLHSRVHRGTYRAQPSKRAYIPKADGRKRPFSPAVSNKAATAIRAEIRSWNLPKRSDKAIEDLSHMFNPIVRGWIRYYGRYYPSALYPTMRQLDRDLALWAKRKYRKLRGHLRRATHWIARISRRAPALFACWQMGVRR